MPLGNIFFEQEFCVEPTIPQEPNHRPLLATCEANGKWLFVTLLKVAPISFTDVLIRLSALPTSSSCSLQLSPNRRRFPLAFQPSFDQLGDIVEGLAFHAEKTTVRPLTARKDVFNFAM